MVPSRKDDKKSADIAADQIAFADALSHEWTEAATGLVTLVNFVTIVIDADCQAAGRQTPASVVTIKWLCFTAFAAELATRGYVEGRRIWRSATGCIDIVVVMLGILEEIVGATTLDVSLLRLFRLFRLGALAKVISSFSKLTELRKLLRGIAGMLRTLFWAALLLLFSMTTWAIVAVTLLHPLIQELGPTTFEECPRCVRSFSSVGAANLTFLQTIVMGDEWGALAVPVIEAYPWTIFVFGGSLLTTGIGLLNLAVAVIVDAAAEARAEDDELAADLRKQAEMRERRNIAGLFRVLDKENTGLLTMEQLEEGMENVEAFRVSLRAMNISQDDLADLFEIMDEDASGEVDVHEFVDALLRMKSGSQSAMSLVKHHVTKMQRKQVDLVEVLETLGKQTANIEEGIYRKQLSQRRKSKDRSSNGSTVGPPCSLGQTERFIDILQGCDNEPSDSLLGSPPPSPPGSPTHAERMRRIRSQLKAVHKWTDLRAEMLEKEPAVLDFGELRDFAVTRGASEPASFHSFARSASSPLADQPAQDATGNLAAVSDALPCEAFMPSIVAACCVHSEGDMLRAVTKAGDMGVSPPLEPCPNPNTRALTA